MPNELPRARRGEVSLRASSFAASSPTPPTGGERRGIPPRNKKGFAAEEAKRIGEELGIDWTKFDVEQFRMGMDVELEHGTRDFNTNVTNDDFFMTGKIALAHLSEFPDYYTRLEKMEKEAKDCWGKQ